ncbi:uncharacterized protein LOC110106546 isoform X1 [Dendrobium catenatum]|uniref:uncharacterized protein LOC110106546 isoform X1 n=1 Tax=Dendrobium catenatum TaxID=906689 RepID=UPI00109F486B|nr:uncharacterized protein LOC110106546 isoform X1 [Dendrobium catenatum]
MLKSDVATGASWVGVGAGEGLQEKNVANKLRSFSSNESGRRGLRVLCPKRHRLQRHGSVAAAGFYGICAAFRYWLVQCDVEVGDDGPGILVTWPLSEGNEPLSKSIGDPLFTVPITIVSRELLQDHLSSDSEMLHGERILDNNSDDDGCLFGKGLDSRENYDLSIIQIGDEGFSKKSGKCKKRNSNKK